MQSLLKTGYVLFLCLLFTSVHSQTVKPTHPRLFIDSSTIIKLQNRALLNTTEYQELQTRISAISGYSSEEIMDIVYEGQHYAFYYSLSYYATGNLTHRDSAVSLFQHYFDNYTDDSTLYWDSGYESRSTMVNVAMLYDWLYNYLPEPFRTNVRTRLIYWVEWMLHQPSTYGIWPGPEFDEGNNYSMGHLLGITSVGYAIHSENPVKGNQYITTADSVLNFMLNYSNTRLKGGDANEGWGYGAGYAINFFRTMAIIKTATVTGINRFNATSYDEDVMDFLPIASLPDLDHMLAEGDWARESTGELWDYHRYVADLVSSYSNTTTAQQIAAFWGKETVPFSDFQVTAYRWFPFLFFNNEITPLDYRTAGAYTDLRHYTDTTGTDQLIQRTGWSNSDQWISYRGGARYGDHGHNGSGHFSIYENGWLIIDKNIQSASGIEGSDSMHNCIHFDVMNNDELYPFLGYPNAEHTQGKRRDFTSEYTYLWTNSTPVYKARESYFNNVEQNERQFFYLPALRKIAIFDLTETVSTTYDQRFGLTYENTPSLSSDSSYSWYSNGSKTAYSFTCYPHTKEVQVNGNSLRVGNKITQAKDYFMHLVSVVSSSATTPTALSVTRENGRILYSDFYGSFHTETGKNYCILFAGDNPSYEYDSLVYELPSNQPLHSYLIGMEPSTIYYISYVFPYAGAIRVHVSINNHPGAQAYTSTAGGIISFEFTETTSVNESQATITFHSYYSQIQHQIIIENYSLSNYNAQLFNASGQIVKTVSENSKNFNRIPTDDLSSGLYILTIQTPNGNQSKKIIIP